MGNDDGFVTINEDGFLVRRDTGEVIDRLVEGTLDRPARPMRSEPLNRRGVFVVGVRPMDSKDRGFEDFVAKVEGVLLKHGVRFHKSQVENLAFRLRAIGRSQRVLEVLDCVLDPECNMFNSGVRAQVGRAFEEVFGPGSLVRAQIASELRRWRLDDLFSVDEVYAVYGELVSLLRALREVGLVKSSAYRITLIRAAIADLILRGDNPDELAEVESQLRNIAGWGRALELLKQIRGLQHYLGRSMQASNSTS